MRCPAIRSWTTTLSAPRSLGRTPSGSGARSLAVYSSVDVVVAEDDGESAVRDWSKGHQLLDSHDENRLCWRRDECVGTWLENHFMYRRDVAHPAANGRGA
jgi:hypothetical protein